MAGPNAELQAPVSRPVIRSPIALLEEDWTFMPSPVPLRIRAQRVRHRFVARLPAPAYQVVRMPDAHRRWNLLFLFLPAGTLDPAQREILRRVRLLSGRLFVVFAASSTIAVPAELDVADAIVHKAIEGFDFSGYTLGLSLIAERSPGADVYVQNDSVLGPLADIDALMGRARWDLTGFMASAALENHLSSLAFILKAVTIERMAALSGVFSRQWCYDAFKPVVLSQEVPLGRIAHRSMSVGAFFYMPTRPSPQSWRQRIDRLPNPGAAARFPLDLGGDAMLGSPLELLDRGFPFLKRSLFGKFEGISDLLKVRERLTNMGWNF